MGASIAVVLVLSAMIPAPTPALGRLDTTEFVLDTTSGGYVNSAQSNPSVGFNGENYLVAWTDAVGWVRCSRVTQDGTLLDPEGTVVYNAAAGHGPRVASDGSDFLVVWNAGNCIYGARVSPAGVVLDNVVISHPTTGGRGVTRVAYGGANYLVVWQDSRGGRTSGQYDIYASRVSPSGVVLDTQGIKLSNPASFLRGHLSPAVASDGRSFMVAWETNITGLWDVRFSRVTGGGAVLDSGGVILSGEGEAGRSPMIASDGTNYLVTWSGSMTAGDIRGKRVSPDGVILDRTSIAVCAAPDAQDRPDVTFDGTNYFAVWQDMRNGWYDIYAARVTPDGAALDPVGVPVSVAENGQDIPALAAGTRNLLVAWRDNQHDIRHAHVHAVLLDSTGSVQGQEIPFSPQERYYLPQTNPAAVFDGTNYFVVWQDSQPGTTQWDILGARVTPTGTILDQPPLRISTASDFQWSPAVAFGASEYLVTWNDRRFGANAGWAVYGSRVSTSGVVLDTGGICIRRRRGYNMGAPAISFDGTNFLSMWSDGWTYARFINQAGQFLDSVPFPITTTPTSKLYPCVTYRAGGYFVAWADHRESEHYTVIYGVRLDESGGRRDTGDLLLSQINMTLPAVTSDATDFLVVWQDEFEHGVYASRVSGDGRILAPASYPVCPGPGHTWYPTACFDGENYIVAWQDDRNGNADVYGAKLDAALSSRDTFGICVRSGDQTTPTVVSGPGGQVLVAFAGVVSNVGGNPASGQRIWGKLISVPGPISPMPLWPPNNHVFRTPPVWVMVDTTRPEIDTYDFQIRYAVSGDTLFRRTTTVPRCTIPDTVLVNGGMHVWQCRAHTRAGWSRFGDERRFGLDLQSVAVSDSSLLPGQTTLFVSSIWIGRNRTLSFKLANVPLRARLELLDASGRQVRRLSVPRNGTVSWNLKDAYGRRAGPGIYFARLSAADRVITRKFLIAD